ncbi:hypothetical protein Mapa_012070 [Marchantia paleacea]|nr:hypothetical protein Mapa_012070 [Marchantia paleacea]
MADFESSHPTLLASDVASWFTSDQTWLFQAFASQPSSSPFEFEGMASDTTATVVSSFTITPDVSEMRTVFEKFDENNDGLICSEDLRSFMSRLGFQMSEEEARLMLESVDHNQDGRVDFEEFLSLYKALCDGESMACASASASTSTSSSTSAYASASSPNSDMEVEKHCIYEEDSTLLEAFRVFDKNQDGVITAEELQSVLLDLGMPEGRSLRNCEKMIETVDADGNGVIDISEFKQMMNSSYAFC